MPVLHVNAKNLECTWGYNADSKVLKSPLTGFIVSVRALPPHSMLRLGFGLLDSVQFPVAVPCVLGLFAVLPEL